MSAGEQMLLIEIRNLLKAILIHLRKNNDPLYDHEKEFDYRAKVEPIGTIYDALGAAHSGLKKK